MVLKPISELPANGPNNTITVTHFGKKKLLERSFVRFKESQDYLDKLDNAYMFFNHAFHLKEWIQHFSGKKDFKENWKNNYAENPYYILCQDFCNKSKHFQLTRPEVTNNISLIPRNYSENNINVNSFCIKFDDKYIEIEILMENIILFWKNYFDKELNHS